MMSYVPLNLFALALFPLAFSAGAVAQESTSDSVPTVQVMILGSYHMASPGLDVINIEAADVLSPEKQREIEAVIDSLARFRPTKIAVERRPERAGHLDSLYSAYLAVEYTLERSEVYQLGFRLADRFDHRRVYPIDHPGEFPFDAVMTYAQEHDPAYVQRSQRLREWFVTKADSLQQHATVLEILRFHNNPENIAHGHAWYVRAAAVGAGDTYVGADLLSAWYERNIRIFANLQQIAEPGDRIIVIFGSGHAAILRELVEGAEGMELIDPLDYL